MTLPPDEYADDLHWHALNYRTAIDATDAWKALEACVDRMLKAALNAERAALAAMLDRTGNDHCAAAIHARGE